LKINLNKQGYSLEDIPYIIQYNKLDLPNVMTYEQMERHINPDGVPAFESIAISGVGVFDSLKAISKLVIAKLSRR